MNARWNWKYALVLTMVLVASPALADGIRYVVASPDNPKAEYALWRSLSDSELCGLAFVRNLDTKKFCEDGIVPGYPPRVGVMTLGTEVEKLDGTACGRMVQVRVLTGPHKGGVGCITGQALSARRPDGATPTPAAPGASAPRPAPDWCKADNVVWLGDRCVEKK